MILALFKQTVLNSWLRRYPDGTTVVGDRELDALYEMLDVAYTDTIPVLCFPWSNDIGCFMDYIITLRTLVSRGQDPLFLYIPYFPGARQDHETPNDRSESLAFYAELVNSVWATTVVLLDPHSDVAPALIDRSLTVAAGDVVANSRDDCRGSHPYDVEYDYVVAPDAGATKRSASVAQVLDVPVVQAWKIRDPNTARISGFGIQSDVEKGKALLVDDICDGGGTFVGLAEVMTENGWPKPDLYVTHGLFNKGVSDLLDKFGHIYSTDSTTDHAENGLWDAVAARPGEVSVLFSFPAVAQTLDREYS